MPYLMAWLPCVSHEADRNEDEKEDPPLNGAAAEETRKAEEKRKRDEAEAEAEKRRKQNPPPPLGDLSSSTVEPCIITWFHVKYWKPCYVILSLILFFCELASG